MRFASLFAIALLLGCGSDDGPTTFERLEVEPAAATLNVPIGGTVAQDYLVFGIAGAERVPISGCTFAIDPSFGMFFEAHLIVPDRGGRTTVTATCPQGQATGSLQVNLTGRIILPGAPDNSRDLFASAQFATDAARTPVIEYPLQGAVSPRNIPSIESQWTAAGNDLFRVFYESRYLAIEAYSASPEAVLPEEVWATVAASSAGDNLRITIDGLAQAAPASKYRSVPVSIEMTNDTIDETAIYWWASSSGAIMSQTFGEVTPPQLVKDQCTSCHSMSRNGQRIGYSRCVGNDCGQLYAGFMRFDPGSRTWTEPVNANDRAIHGSYTTFAPVGNPFPDDSRALAMVTMVNGTLALYDPDTGAAVPSNLAIANTGPQAVSALMADWSADGDEVVYVGTPTANQWIDLDDGRISKMTYQYTGGEHVFGTPTPLVADPITLPSGTYDNFFFPSFSPDGALVVFNAARAAWRNGANARAPGQRLMLTDAAGRWVRDLTALNGGDGDLDITWAHWAPIASNDYYWIVFSSERDYGHRTTAATSPASCRANGVTQCKQIWMSAIRRDRLTGQVDPSAPPMWLPGQDALANNISPYWSVPAEVR